MQLCHPPGVRHSCPGPTDNVLDPFQCIQFLPCTLFSLLALVTVKTVKIDFNRKRNESMDWERRTFAIPKANGSPGKHQVGGRRVRNDCINWTINARVPKDRVCSVGVREQENMVLKSQQKLKQTLGPPVQVSKLKLMIMAFSVYPRKVGILVSVSPFLLYAPSFASLVFLFFAHHFFALAFVHFIVTTLIQYACLETQWRSGCGRGCLVT